MSLGLSLPAGAPSGHPEILAEVRRLQEKQSSWASALLILGVSVALFVFASATGGGEGSWFSLESLAILVPVLLFHEAGHYVAMRAFGYRNLKMFFIPFFGAAVTGRHYNVPGWKKAVVSLMGPLPGIAAGAMIGVLGLIAEQPLLIKTALVALSLNGFNLLPLLPLDGGWIVHTVFFCRHPLLEVLFRGAAVLSLAGLGLAAGDRVLLFLAVFMAIGIPLSYRLAKVTAGLRQAGLDPVSPDDQTIPAATAEAIIERVKPMVPARSTNAQVAQHVLQTFETLNARPPGWFASIAIVGVQGAALVAALVFAVALVVGQRGVH